MPVFAERGRGRKNKLISLAGTRSTSLDPTCTRCDAFGFLQDRYRVPPWRYGAWTLVPRLLSFSVEPAVYESPDGRIRRLFLWTAE